MENTPSHDVFISFSFKDQPTVQSIAALLGQKHGISYWICTEEIRGGDDFYDIIEDAVESCKVFLLMQTEHSVQSDEVKDEIYAALRENKRIIRFVLDGSELRKGVRLKLKNRQHVDGQTGTLDQAVDRLAEEIRLALAQKSAPAKGSGGEETEMLLSTPNVVPKPIFHGRDDVLREIHRRFREGERVLFLQGIGGIGKTQIVKKYARDYGGEYDTVVYATYEKSLRDLIVAEEPFSLLPQMSRTLLPDGTKESDEAFFRRKLKKISALSDQRTLVIIDNFDTESDADLPALAEGNYRLLITTRSDFSRFYAALPIEEIHSDEALLAIFRDNYDGDEVDFGDPALIELFDKVNRHTYTIELLAQHMENSGQTPREMIEALEAQGITSLDEEVRNSDMTTTVAYENLLKMFRIFSLTAEDRQILSLLSLMPLEGVKSRDFRHWSGLASPKPLKSLLERSWIIKNTEGIALHPIVRQVVCHEVPPTVEGCTEFRKRFCESIDEVRAWHMKKSEKDHYAAVAKGLLSVFRTITPETEVLYYHTEVLLSFAVDPEGAVTLAERLFEYCLATHGEKDYRTGRAAYKLGWAYAYNTALPDALAKAAHWLEIADRILGAVDLVGNEQKTSFSQTKVNLAKTRLLLYQKSGAPADLAQAKAHAEFAVAYTKKYYDTPGDPQRVRIAGASLQLADVLLEAGEWEEALKSVDVALPLLITAYTETDSDVMFALHRKSAILYALGRYEEALPIAARAAAGYADFFGESHPIVADAYRVLGDCHKAVGNEAEAAQAHEKAKTITEKLYG